MTAVIDLGEPDRYEPGQAPILRRYRGLPRYRRRRILAAVLVVLAGAVGGVGPRPQPDPQLHQVGRARGSLLTHVVGDAVIVYGYTEPDIVAYSLDGAGARWSLPVDQQPSDIASAGDLIIIAFIGESFLESTTKHQDDLPPRILAVDAATGRTRWQILGWPVSPLSGPVVAVGSATVPDQRVEGIDVRTGQRVWEGPLTGSPMPGDPGPSGRVEELVIVQNDGAVLRMSLATGQTQHAGRVIAGAEGVFVWRGLLGVRRRVPSGDDFLLYRLGGDRPLWQMTMWANSPTVSPCGDHLCTYDSAGVRRLDPLTGTVLATIGPDSPDPEQAEGPWRGLAGTPGLGEWQTVDVYRGHALVRLDPSFARDGRAWLGEAVRDGSAVRVRPLMPIGPRSNSCTIVPGWLFCDGSAVDDAVSVRLSELDALLTPRTA